MTTEKYGRKARALVRGRSTPTRATYFASSRRARSSRSGRALQPGDTLLDLACGDGGPGGLPAGACATSASMRAARWSRWRSGAAGTLTVGDLNDYEPPSRSQATTCFRAIYYARRPARLLPSRRRLHRAQVRLRPQSEAVPRRGRARRPAGGRLRRARRCGRSSSPQTIPCRSRRCVHCVLSSRAGRSREPCSRCGSATCALRSAAAGRCSSTFAPSLRRSPDAGSSSCGTKVGVIVTSTRKRGPGAFRTTGFTSLLWMSNRFTSVAFPRCGCLSSPTTIGPIATVTCPVTFVPPQGALEIDHANPPGLVLLGRIARVGAERAHPAVGVDAGDGASQPERLRDLHEPPRLEPAAGTV